MAIAEIPTTITYKTTGRCIFKNPKDKFSLPSGTEFGILTAGLVLEVNHASNTASIIESPYIVGEGAFSDDPNKKRFKALIPSSVDVYHVNLLYNNPDLRNQALILAAKRGRDSIEKAADMFNLSVKRRCAKLLAQISESFGGVELGLPLSHRELSQVVGSSREAAVKTTNLLEKIRLLNLRNGWITIKPEVTEKLWAIANGEFHFSS